VGNWRKSTYSDANGGDCIEVASTDVILVRDTRDRSGVVLKVTTKAWQKFIASLNQEGRLGFSRTRDNRRNRTCAALYLCGTDLRTKLCSRMASVCDW
jgi:hypothetical protein